MPIFLTNNFQQVQGRHTRELGGARSGWSTQGGELGLREVGEGAGQGYGSSFCRDWGALKDLGQGSKGILCDMASSLGLQGPDFAGSFPGSPDGGPRVGIARSELRRTGAMLSHLKVKRMLVESCWGGLWTAAGRGQDRALLTSHVTGLRAQLDHPGCSYLDILH